MNLQRSAGNHLLSTVRHGSVLGQGARREVETLKTLVSAAKKLSGPGNRSLCLTCSHLLGSQMPPPSLRICLRPDSLSKPRNLWRQAQFSLLS